MSTTPAQLHQSVSMRARVATFSRTSTAIDLAAIVVIVVGCALFFAYLLSRYPYDGLYGQDSYAYYYQARALLQDITGAPPPPWQLFTSDGLYHWPIGYHLQVMLGLLFTNSPTGGRVLTILMTIGCAVLLYLIVGRVLTGASHRARVVAGLVAAAGLPLDATFTRMGLSLMADVPALFWGLLGIYCFLRAWPPGEHVTQNRRRTIAWAAFGGFALGLGVLTRYGTILLLLPLGLYLIAVWLRQRKATQTEHFNYAALAFAAVTFLIALLPQVLYILSHQSSANVGYSSWVAGWTPANLFRTTVTSADGSSTYPQPMIVFYLLQPFYDSDAGFLSALFIPAWLVGLSALIYKCSWLLLGALLASWVLSALFFAATPYQAQRFVLVYLPALLIMLGIGVATAVELAITALRSGKMPVRVLALGAAAVVILGSFAGVYKQQASVKSWMAIHSSFKADEQKFVSLTKEAAGTFDATTPPRIVAFGATAALYHYTQWPIIELYNSDENAISIFYNAPGTHLLVLPVESMSTQWANTTLSARWQWMQQTYVLTAQGKAGAYTVYKVETRP